MRRSIRLSAYGVAVAVAGALVAAGFAVVSASATASAASTTSLPITGYYQMAVDSGDSQVFMSQGKNGSDSILVTDFSGNVVGTIGEPSPVGGIALSPDGSTLYAVLVGSSTESPAISVISTASLTQTTTYPIPAGDAPMDVAVQSGKLWVSYSTNDDRAAYIGDFDLSAAAPVLQTQAAMGGWGWATPMLAADPTGAGNVLVAASANALTPIVVSYNTSTASATVRANTSSLAGCSGDEYDYAMDIAVAPGGAGFILACESATGEREYQYGTDDLTEEATYGGYGQLNAVAVASSTGLVAAGSAAPQVAVYTSSGTTTNDYAPADSWSTADRGVGLNANGSELFQVTSVVVGDGSEFELNTYSLPGQTPTSVTLAQPANAIAGHNVTITGTLTIGGDAASNTPVDITRTGAGQPSASFDPTVRAGQFTWIDTPLAGGTYTYTATYPATAYTAASSASIIVTAAKATPSLSLTVTPATASYGAAVKYNAVVHTIEGPVSTLTVYAQQVGQAKVKLAGFTGSGSWNVSGTAHFDRNTTIYAVYSGNAANAAMTVMKTVSVGASVSLGISGYYGSKPGYRLYHHTVRVDLSSAVAPAKPGQCIQFQVQEYVAKVWKVVATTGCATLNAKSQATGYLTVSKYALGVPYRVRADYVRGKDTSNIDADSGFLSFEVEK